MLTGRCLCGGVSFAIDEELGPIIYCHCSMCRRATGSAFAANASVRAESFRITSGEQMIHEYQSSPDGVRGFCSRCGSPIYGRSPSMPSFRRVRLGSFDGDPGSRAVANIWMGSKSAWFEVADHLEQFEEEPPARYCAPAKKR
jgi:hypothetical protein